MKKHRKVRQSSEIPPMISDGSQPSRDYGTQDYTDFLSNGHTNNEKVEAIEYFESFLDET
ncbi:MAG: hypothetical protein VZR73_01230 [Acutalibacteraceae bacterium]|nr:hypothetical protein [Clostridia bacterium]MEE3402688.1 hypothetical protein [Acutalibacteraceae bacterium]